MGKGLPQTEGARFISNSWGKAYLKQTEQCLSQTVGERLISADGTRYISSDGAMLISTVETMLVSTVGEWLILTARNSLISTVGTSLAQQAREKAMPISFSTVGGVLI